MSAETEAAQQYLYAKTTADATLVGLVPGGFHSEYVEVAPSGRYVIWSYQGATDVTSAQAFRVMTVCDFLVRVIDRTSDTSTLAPAAKQLDAVLHRTLGSVPGYTILWCVRQGPYSSTERIADIERRHLGGYYRLYVQAS